MTRDVAGAQDHHYEREQRVNQQVDPVEACPKTMIFFFNIFFLHKDIYDIVKAFDAT